MGAKNQGPSPCCGAAMSAGDEGRGRWSRARRGAANLALPGLGYLLLGRRRVLGGLLVAYSLTWAFLGVLHLLTIDAHWGHLHPSALPGIGAQVMLFVALHLFVGVGTTWDAIWGEAPPAREGSADREPDTGRAA